MAPGDGGPRMSADELPLATSQIARVRLFARRQLHPPFAHSTWASSVLPSAFQMLDRSAGAVMLLVVERLKVLPIGTASTRHSFDRFRIPLLASAGLTNGTDMGRYLSEPSSLSF